MYGLDLQQKNRTWGQLGPRGKGQMWSQLQPLVTQSCVNSKTRRKSGEGAGTGISEEAEDQGKAFLLDHSRKCTQFLTRTTESHLRGCMQSAKTIQLIR